MDLGCHDLHRLKITNQLPGLCLCLIMYYYPAQNNLKFWQLWKSKEFCGIFRQTSDVIMSVFKMSDNLNICLLAKLTQNNDARFEYLISAVDAAENAGQMIKEAFYQDKNISSKSCSSDLVTETDQKVEKYLIQYFKEKFPDHCFIGEESVADGESCNLTEKPTWIVDPVDGTTNFVHRFPFVAVSIGLSINNQIEVGVIYGPILNKLYVAVRGEGAYCGIGRLHVSSCTDLSDALLISEWGANRNPDILTTKTNSMKDVIGRREGPAHGLRSLGSAAWNMCMVASGSSDAYFEWGIHCWDMAAGLLLIEEAGGVITDAKGGDFDLMGRNLICASSKELVEQVAKLVTHIELPKD